MGQRYVVVDLETTGNSPKKGDKIIQFAAVVIENDEIVDQYSTFIRPEQEISMFIEELTGISQDTVKDAPLFEEVAGKITALLNNSSFVAHNVFFDLAFLTEELERCGYEPFYGDAIDTVELAKIVKPTSDGYKLNQLAKEEQLTHLRPHQADSDAEVTAQLFLQFKKKLKTLPILTLKQLHKLSFSLKSDLASLLDECISEKMIKVQVPNPTITIHRGIAFKKRTQQRESDEHQVDYPFSDQAKMNLIKTAFPSFEEREGQINMMDLIYEMFKTHGHTIIEAGTGIGKSLGYLLPAVYFSKQVKQPVVISTYTLQLQEQLLRAEIPKLKKIIQMPFQAVLLKGRSNYLSLAKFKRILVEKDNNYETALAKMQILVWLTETETGDKDELHLSSGGEFFWERLQSNESTRYNLEKQWVEFDFFEQAKAVAANADLIITNHAFLLSDLLSKNRLIPENGYLILDEAHHLERAATKNLGKKLDYLSVKMLMNRIGTSDQKQLLYRLESILVHHQLPEYQSVSSINETINDFIYEYDQLFIHLGAQANQIVKTKGPKKIPIKLKDDHYWKYTVMLTERLVGYLQRIVSTIQSRVDALLELSPPDILSKNSLGYLNDLELALREMNLIKEALTEFFIKQKDESVYWLEYSKKVPQQGITLLSHPVSGKDLIWDTFFSKQKSVVMTSATLCVKQSFDFFIEQLGMERVKVNTAYYPSPFQYDKQVKVLVPEESPNIKKVTIEEYTVYTADYVITAALAAKGRMMILFTSHELLRAVYQMVKDSELLPDFTLFGQGISGGSKMRLLKNFQVFEKALLFGTTSFWEGVDIPGEDLSCLMIVRLPFSPPDEPVTEAKCHLLEMQGKNPFWTYSLPEAILRFRQGFGRLIRTTTDKGVLIVLDRRILTTSYGKEFQLAIPPVSWEEVSQSELTEAIEKWI